MPRLRQVRRSEVDDPVIAYIYNRKFGDRDPVEQPGTALGAPGNWETVFAQSPDIFEHAMRGFGIWQKGGRKLDPVLRELAITRAGWASGSRFVYSQHCKVLRGEGASEALVINIPAWQVSDVYSPVQRAVLAYADCLADQHGRASDTLFGVLKQHLCEEAIIELTYFTAMYVMHAAMSRALRLEFDDVDDAVSEVPAPKGFTYGAARTPMVLPPR